jgi:hypothetical protein
MAGSVDKTLDTNFPGDPVSQVIAGTLIDRGIDPDAAVRAVEKYFDYDDFGRIVDKIEELA